MKTINEAAKDRILDLNLSRLTTSCNQERAIKTFLEVYLTTGSTSLVKTGLMVEV